MKNFIKYSPIFLCILFTLCSCGKQNSEVENMYNNDETQTTNGTALFSKDFCDNIQEIVFYSFDETTISINDSAKIKSTLELLQANNYQQIVDENSLKEGFYMIDLVTESTTYSLGFTTDCISFGGNQYIIEDSTADLATAILEILEID